MKLVSLNIEGSRHLKERVLPFLEREKPDILCVQELVEADIGAIAALIGLHHAFAPMVHGHIGGVSGVGIFSRALLTSVRRYYYRGSADIVGFDPADMRTVARVLLTVMLEMAGEEYTVATTHFTWSAGGEATDFQRKDVEKLLASLKSEKSIVLAGDFNAPRGQEIFSVIAARYADHIPVSYTTSIYGALHKTGPKPYMVDGLFSTPDYAVSNVRLVPGVSDHCAIVAEVTKGT